MLVFSSSGEICQFKYILQADTAIKQIFSVHLKCYCGIFTIQFFL